MKLEYHKDNLTLRILNERDAIQVLDFYARNAEYFDCYETEKPDNFYTLDFIKNLLNAEYNGFLHGKYVRMFLFDDQYPDEIIGCVSFSDIRGGAMTSCATGYKIDKKYQCQGYAKKMLAMALGIMIMERGMHRIEAYICPDNTPSIALVQKLGFISEGTAYSYVQLNGMWQDHLRYVYIAI